MVTKTIKDESYLIVDCWDLLFKITFQSINNIVLHLQELSTKIKTHDLRDKDFGKIKVRKF